MSSEHQNKDEILSQIKTLRDQIQKLQAEHGIVDEMQEAEILLRDKTRENKRLHHELARVTAMLDASLYEVEGLKASIEDLKQNSPMQGAYRELSPGKAQTNVPQHEKVPQFNFYRLLGVDFGADPRLIRYAYSLQAEKYDPNNSKRGNIEMFALISSALIALSDPQRREVYDESLRKSHHKDEMHSTCIKILKLLYGARKKRPSTGGASGRELMENIGTSSITEVEFPLFYLREKRCIEVGERRFQITAEGIDYLHQYFDDDIPPHDEDSPYGGGPWPPKRDPDDPSRVPLRQKPSGGAGEISLPLPDPPSE